jgi:hypothetical protein
MANDVAKFFGGHQLPDRAKLSETLANFSAAKNSLMGKALLRLTKTGVWVFGADNESLKNGTRLVGNPSSLQAGYVAWWMGKIEGEKMQSISSGPVDPTTLGPVNSGGVPPGKTQTSGKGWENQASIDLITQADVPLCLMYKTSSLGGMKTLLTLAGEIAYGMSENPARVYPVIELDTDSYIHKEFGEVHTPVMSIVGWLDAEGKEVKEVSSLL